MRSLPRLTAGIAVLLAVAAGPSAAGAQSSQRTHGLDAEPRTTTASVAQAAPAPAGWCPNTEPGANQVDNGQYRYLAIYAHAADRPSRLPALGGRLQQDAFSASGVIESQYGRAIRFDMGTPCGPDQLDISSVELPFTEAELAALAAARGTATFDAVAQALRAAGYGVAENDEPEDRIALRSLNFLVWLDGPAPERACGQGTALIDSTRADTNLNNFGGKLAVIFRDGSDFCGPDVVRHEIGHNLGALQPDAPNTTDGVHCNDAFEDTMCGWEAPKLADGVFNGLWFDYGNDDYWDPPQGEPLGWWTLNLSRFICPDTTCNRPAPPRPPAAAQRTAPAPPKPAPRANRARPARSARPPRLSRSARHGRIYTRLRLRARGQGSARLVVRCPRRPQRRRVVSRRIALPAIVRVRTTCRAPRARLVRWHRPRAGHFGDAQ